MEFYTGITGDEIKETSKKYGAAMVIMIFNSSFFVFVTRVLLTPIISYIPDAAELLDRSADKGYLFLMLYNEFASYVIPLAACWYLFRKELKYKPRPDDFLPVPDYNRFFGMTVLMYLVGWLAATAGGLATSYISTLLNKLFGAPEVKAAFSSMMPSNIFTFIAFIVCLCIIAPICEELIYRHILLKPLRKYSDTVAALLTSAIFALSHFNFDQFLYAFAFGFFLAMIAMRTNSIVPTIICHSLNNIIACLKVYLPDSFDNESLDAVFDVIRDIMPTVSLIMLIISFIALALFLFAKLFKLKNNCNLSISNQLGAIVSSPALIAGVVLCFAYTVVRLYI